ncbi:uncharacterized protein LOC127850379 [Dreissena polymorpha]|uniref:uncharacterized protein LOC127850379 n=1 Tax=Dreissena polymorpha TaxID=45954 RepID=UPI002264DD1C|nr:uncharacterized protein LOC127850379 [Dreissena polymorpha]
MFLTYVHFTVLLCVLHYRYVHMFSVVERALELQPVDILPEPLPVVPPRTVAPPLSVPRDNGTTPQSSISGSQDVLDLAFIMDTTGSMSSYIHTARENIRRVVDETVQSSKTDIRFALVEYRDHPPQDSTFVVRTHDFTSSVLDMKSWLDRAEANGGGDTPEAVADALNATTGLSWRKNVVKVAVLISDAPPHGLEPDIDNTFKQGGPNGLDPIAIAHEIAKLGVTMYAVGCEPDITPYKDLFMAIAHITGGQYIPLNSPRKLIDAIIGGAKEELSLQQFATDVRQEVKKVIEAGGQVDEKQIANNVYQKLHSANVETTQLLLNDQPLEGPTGGAIEIAATRNMSEARKVFTKGAPTVRSFATVMSEPVYFGRAMVMPSLVSDGSAMMAEGEAMLPIAALSASAGVGSASWEPEVYTAAKKAISIEQVNRLVKKETAKLAR